MSIKTIKHYIHGAVYTACVISIGLNYYGYQIMHHVNDAGLVKWRANVTNESRQETEDREQTDIAAQVSAKMPAKAMQVSATSIAAPANARKFVSDYAATHPNDKVVLPAKPPVIHHDSPVQQ